jgi:hypothetical protein
VADADATKPCNGRPGPKQWPAVELVAEVLLQRVSPSGEEVRSTIEQILMAALFSSSPRRLSPIFPS